ncbi:MAG TPA: hypothetical protein VMO26_07985 [Vicinamibacterales bacterium]|nr:hypothetical protein [Vicinamibacterales bacterium]
MTLTRTFTRRAGFGLIVAASVVTGACFGRDDISGPASVIGPPLLDMELSVASAPVFPAASVSVNATRDTLTLNISNLPPLPPGSVYQVLLVDTTAATSNAIVGSGTLITTNRRTRPVNRDVSVIETTVDTAASANAITDGGAANSYSFVIADADIGGNISAYTHAVVVVNGTAETGVQTVDADDPRGFLARRYRSGASYSSGSLTFGTWSIASAVRQPFAITAASLDAGFWGDDLIANFELILRPPEGFRYVGWLVDDRTGSQQRVGGLATPPPERRSLVNADVEAGSFLTEDAIVEAQLRQPVTTPDNYTRFVVVLEPKGSAGAPRASLAEVFAAAIPRSISVRHPGAGKLAGKVTSTSASTVDSSTVYLTAPNRPEPLLVNITNATGDFLFRTVNVGEYTVKVIPPGDSIVRDSTNITIGVADGATVGDSVFVSLTIP